MRRCARTRARPGDGAPYEVPPVHPRRLRIWLIWSPIAALAAQLLLASATAASTGGGDFPRLRTLLTFL